MNKNKDEKKNVEEWEEMEAKEDGKEMNDQKWVSMKEALGQKRSSQAPIVRRRKRERELYHSSDQSK